MPDRIEREKKTIEKMIGLYCRAHHQPAHSLCDECQSLLDYALLRLEKCPFQPDKPTCASCPVHCYNPQMRTKVKEIMRYSGPHMLLHHPALAVMHLFDGRKPAPILRKKR